MDSRRPLTDCPLCDGTGTQYGPGDVIPGWCIGCYGAGTVTIEERAELDRAARLLAADEEALATIFVVEARYG